MSYILISHNLSKMKLLCSYYVFLERKPEISTCSPPATRKIIGFRPKATNQVSSRKPEIRTRIIFFFWPGFRQKTKSLHWRRPCCPRSGWTASLSPASLRIQSSPAPCQLRWNSCKKRELICEWLRRNQEKNPHIGQLRWNSCKWKPRCIWSNFKSKKKKKWSC